MQQFWVLGVGRLSEIHIQMTLIFPMENILKVGADDEAVSWGDGTFPEKKFQEILRWFSYQ